MLGEQNGPEALLHWSERYRVGIEAVDYEHQELIALINRLYAALSVSCTKLNISAFLGDLFRAISAHFALEERFMGDRRYGQLAEHKADHERLLDEIRDIMDGFERSDAMDTQELAKRLDIWFSKHFETHDARLHKALGSHIH